MKLKPSDVGKCAVLENGEVQIIEKHVKEYHRFYTNGGVFDDNGKEVGRSIGNSRIVAVFDPHRLLKAAESVVKNYDVHRHPFIRDLKDALPKKGK